EPHEIRGLEYLTTYILHEDKPPFGYELAEDIKFVVGEVDEVVMKDVLTKVSFSKQDSETGEELSGAKLSVLDKDGNVITSWTSTDKPHEITGLEYLATYILHEDEPPVGYERAEDIEFVVGKVDEVVMRDVLTRVFIEKRDKLSREVLANCEIDIIDDETEEIVARITSSEELTLVNLVAGRTYRLHEVEAPEGYTLASEDVTFQAEDGMTATIYDEPLESPAGGETSADDGGVTGYDPSEPQTNDASPLAVIVALLVMSFAGMTSLAVYRRRWARK
ncbi:MAG: hypothetical protein LBL36_05555, partial [Clostridiales Family XIII bacterium]|nr:hypothetical protein [Clostridiales Family XIII bacterium]